MKDTIPLKISKSEDLRSEIPKSQIDQSQPEKAIDLSKSKSKFVIRPHST